MPLGSTFWAYIAPVEKTNLPFNPSFERGTSGVAAIQGATIGSVANKQQFGAWSCAVTPSSNGTSGGAFGTWVAGNGTDYTVSAYVNGVNGVAYMIGVGDSSGLNLVGSTAFTGGGTWQRYQYSYSEASGATRRPVIRKTSGNDTGTYYVDGVQVEVGSITTYIDGDQEGCIWLGAPHASQSTRSGQSRAGGSVIALADIGFTVSENPGIGMPQVENSSQSFAIVPGAEFQRQRARERVFTLSSYLSGTTYEDLHQQRKAAINAFNIDAFTPQQPTRFLYTGGMGTVQIDAVYSGGLEFGKPDGFTEIVSAHFVAYDPFWRSTTDEGTTLAPRIGLGSANAIVRRDPLGRWGTMGAHGTSLSGTVDGMLMAPTGTLFVAGRITSADGTVSRGLVMYFPSTNCFGSMGGTLTPGAVNSAWALAWSPWGSLYIGGDFAGISGTATRFMAQWNGNYGSLAGGTVNQRVWSLAVSPTGTVFSAGSFLTANGTTAPRLAIWMPAGSWGTLVGQGAGTINDDVFDLTFGLGYDPLLYFTGKFGSAGGTAMNGIGQWRRGTFGTMGSGLQFGAVGGAQGNTIATGLNGIITIAGFFGTAGGVEGTHAAQWNGVSYTIPAGGIGTSELNQVQAIAVHPRTGDIYATGIFNWNSKNIPFPDGMAVFNGYTWKPLDIDTPVKLTPSGIANAIAFGADNSLYVGGYWAGTAYAAAVAAVVNRGATDAYPVFSARNTGSGTARIYQLVNTLTGDGIYFNYVLLPGEELTLTTTPGDRSFTSTFFGNVFGYILPGSNITTFRLQPGTNYISLFSDNDSLVSALYWRDRHPSGDSGTVY